MIEVVEAGAGRRLVEEGEFRQELEIGRRAVSAVFAPERLALVAGVSEQILGDRSWLSTPGVVHFAYWTRRSALKALSGRSISRVPRDCLARPCGLVFHLPPQNVETVFLYSWVISYLAGNANLTRLPTSLGGQMSGLLDLFQHALAACSDRSQFFVRYPVDGSTNRDLCAMSDARLVWGGDEKVRAFAPLPLRNGGKSLWFGDRRSLAIVRGAAIASLTAAERRDIAQRLHSDIFVFDQMACSSPLRLYVVGDEAAHGAATDALMADLSSAALSHGTAPPTGHVIHKMVASMAIAARGGGRHIMRHSNALTTLVKSGHFDTVPVGGGFLEVVFRGALEEIGRDLSENVQTAVHFGFEAVELERFAQGLPPFCVTRIVPVGQALDFDSVWDGYDLPAELTRLLRIQVG